MISTTRGQLAAMHFGLGGTNIYMWKTMLDPYYDGHSIAGRVQDYVSAMSWQHDIVSKKLLVEEVRWFLPNSSFVKINVDGSCGAGKISGCGGFIRDDRGNWLCGFSKFIGVCNAFMAKVWGSL
ncbi:unnamed protein product [Vicia faba]|uniref:RNase H type-1 domain-containing protein n=1 Tax=Vicia faba TaxID=3906 RepID=A0AAV1A842_VICFA|nr:unnamed protein product [Vicia faba]